mmetsp:Transcript_23736/g.33187  ORF Transcript_23736/g.33187 Transcript_23736/m.33187 type:complete len:357 (+) Transcript_23736:253-1323(+)
MRDKEKGCNTFRDNMAGIRGEAIGACCMQMACGSGFIFLNERMINYIGFPFPLMLSFIGFSGSALISASLVWAGFVHTKESLLQAGVVRIKVLLLSLFVTLSVVLGLASYLYLSVSFIQMLKATTPAMTMAILIMLRMLSFDVSLVGSTFVIVVGAVISSFGEFGISMFGVSIMLTSCLSEALRCVLTQSLLTGTKLSVIEGLYLMSPPCAMASLLAVTVFERDAISKGYEVLYSYPIMFLVAASMGFLQNVTTLWVVQSTNALTLKLLGPLRSIIVVGISVIFLGDSLSGLKGGGYVISLVGLFWYNISRLHNETTAGSGIKSVALIALDPKNEVPDNNSEDNHTMTGTTEPAAS